MEKTITEIFTNKVFWKEFAKSAIEGAFKFSTGETNLIQNMIKQDPSFQQRENTFKRNF